MLLACCYVNINPAGFWIYIFHEIIRDTRECIQKSSDLNEPNANS